MKSKQLTQTLHNINSSIRWSEFLEGKDAKGIKSVERYAKFKYLEGANLNNAIQSIKNFDSNKVWHKSFWGLKVHESICAVAVEVSQNIQKIKKEN